MNVLAWTVFFACVAMAFLLLRGEDPDAYDRARDDSRMSDEESWWELDYHARWNPEVHTDRQPDEFKGPRR